eukprot:Cvel_19810.t1-p1 / transcript=Cvel_19810.t1 / gene=Cvel_19810 / organism=Chromera_velia_CCMP2878 / gene_product=Adenylate kinase, chloroplastic, putative / transcript_product=Adenylate kinase, chloroplastic, putative / location=Cvel_scaffold1734:1-1827(-) / protein_length=609 / sequence_SO=supercontig / SO=protein_coding / is_pseudo=false
MKRLEVGFVFLSLCVGGSLAFLQAPLSLTRSRLASHVGQVAKARLFSSGQEVDAQADLETARVIVAGAPCSGKGTLCKELVRRLNLTHISSGDALRAAAQSETETGRKVKSLIEKGQLVPDELVTDLIIERLRAEDCAGGKRWLLDGFPRRESQVQALYDAGLGPDFYVELQAPEELLVERAVGRRQDPETGNIYHVKFNPPPPDVASRVLRRQDDTEEVIRSRVKDFDGYSGVVSAFFERQAKETGEGPMVVRVDGTSTGAALRELGLTPLQTPEKGSKGNIAALVKEKGGALLSIGLLFAINHAVSVACRLLQINFPPPIAGMLLGIALLFLGDAVDPAATGGRLPAHERVYRLLKPGGDTLGAWLPLFFMPGLVSLPLCEGLNAALLYKASVGICVGWILSFVSTLGLTTGLEKFLGKGGGGKKKGKVGGTSGMFNVTPGGAPPSSTWNALDFVSMVSLTAMLAKLAGASNAQPLRLLAVLLSFDIGKRVKKFSSGLIDPLLTGTILSWMSLAVAAEAGWFELLGRFVTSRGSLGLWRSWGPGDFLLSCLGPSIVSLSLRVYANRKAVKENAPMVLVGSFWGAFFGLVSSAVIAGPLLKMPPSAAL